MVLHESDWSDVTEFGLRIMGAIESIETAVSVSGFSASRWPYTYAYDYVREHSEEFGMGDKELSRSGVAGWLATQVQDEYEKIMVCHLLADAYLREQNISTIVCAECRAPLVQRGMTWYDGEGVACFAYPSRGPQAHVPYDIHPQPRSRVGAGPLAPHTTYDSDEVVEERACPSCGYEGTYHDGDCSHCGFNTDDD